jgi:hypothetical protein
VTPRIERPVLVVGDRVADKRSGGRHRAGRGVIVDVRPTGMVEVRWDGTDHTGLRAVEFLRRLDDA